tara:strand:- start:1012 stop:1347 length:336 start_codon:yes stop_codon:yes gene_type:complete
METIQEIEKLKAKTYRYSRNARLDKVAVDSLIRQKERLKASIYLIERSLSTQKDAEMKAKKDKRIEEIDEKIEYAEKKAGKSWAKLEAHRMHFEAMRGFIATKREELKQGI